MKPTHDTAAATATATAQLGLFDAARPSYSLSPALPPKDLGETLAAWRASGWLRRLDTAFVRFLQDMSPDAPEPLLIAAALLVHMEGRGHSCLDLDDLLHPARRQRTLAWPPEAEAALAVLLQQQPGGMAVWLDAIAASPLVQSDAETAGMQAATPADEAGATPLVLRGSALYLRRYWDQERRVARQVAERSRSRVPVDVTAARGWLDLLFTPREGVAFDWQKAACAIALRSHLSIVTGGPGTGKTYTAARLLALLFAVDPQPERLRVGLAAPTGKAAARLRQSIEASLGALQSQLGDRLDLGGLTAHIGAARTLHSLLGARPDTRAVRYHAAHPLELDVVLVDEASMIHLEMMAALLDALPPSARIVFLGDKDQLASVEAGAVLGDLCRDAQQGRYRADTADYLAATCGQALPADYRADDGPTLAQHTVMLRESQRFGGAIGQLALAANRGDVDEATRLLQVGTDTAIAWLDGQDPAVVQGLALRGRPGAEGGYGAYIAALRARPAGEGAAAHSDWTRAVLQSFEGFRVLSAVREGEWGSSGLNTAIERALVTSGALSRHAEWYEGRPVLVTRNDPGLGVFNGDIGIAMRPAVRGAPMRCYFLDGDAVKSVAVSRLAHVETAFAMTVHKSQGSEFAHTVLVLPRAPGGGLTRELVYTGITRARTAFTLVTGRAAALGESLGLPTRRASGLRERLQQGQAAG